MANVWMFVFAATIIFTQFDCGLAEDLCFNATQLKCYCQSDNTSSINFTVTCTDAKLSTIPNNLGPLKFLIITNDNLKILPVFNDYFELLHLELTYDKITLIQEFAFTNLKRLSYLDLSNNNIIWLNNESFYGLINLEVLKLQKNKIYVLHNDVLTSKSLPSLTLLHLDECYIFEIGKNSFDGLDKLETLNLTNNRIRTLETLSSKDRPLSSLKLLLLGINSISSLPEDFLSNMPALKELDLHTNLFERVNKDQFEPVKNTLETLDLHDNKITEIQSKCFQDFQNVTLIDLSNNQLTELKRKIFPDYKPEAELGLNLIIHDNFLNCEDCDNSWLFKNEMVKRVAKFNDTICTIPERITFNSASSKLFSHCVSDSDQMHTISVAIFVIIVIIFLLLLLVLGLLWCQKKRRQRYFAGGGGGPTITRNNGWIGGGTLANDGDFSYRELDNQNAFSIDDNDDNNGNVRP